MTAEEVGLLIRARQISRNKGLRGDADVTAICELAGVSRKTGYEWAQKHAVGDREEVDRLQQEVERLKNAHEVLLKQNAALRFENEGRKLAFEIHGFDEILASKKNAL